MTKTATVRPHHTRISKRDWDGPLAERHLPNDADERTLRRVFAWVDPEKPESETAAKFPHHDVTANGAVGGANLRACISGISILNGARNPADIPDRDRRGVYKHLAAHLRDAGEEPPELK